MGCNNRDRLALEVAPIDSISDEEVGVASAEQSEPAISDKVEVAPKEKVVEVATLVPEKQSRPAQNN